MPRPSPSSRTSCCAASHGRHAHRPGRSALARPSPRPRASARPSPRARPRRTCCNAVAPAMPELLGGSADLTGSNLTDWKGHRPLHGARHRQPRALRRARVRHGGHHERRRAARRLPPVRRHLPRPSPTTRATRVRMSALMKLPVVYVFTHDSIGLGEDGPTHQPVEHASSLRLIPERRRVAPGRCDRDSGGLARGAAPQRRPQLPAAQPPGPAARRRRQRPRRSHRAGGYVLRRRPTSRWC